tara:strand:- start:28 stop:255 length:228 start_codon:yes stop_codon:yes gene_type:complete
MEQKKLVIGIILVALIILVGCSPQSSVDDTSSDDSAESGEDVEISKGLEDLDELDELESELDDISFDDLESIDIE